MADDKKRDGLLGDGLLNDGLLGDGLTADDELSDDELSDVGGGRMSLAKKPDEDAEPDGRFAV